MARDPPMVKILEQKLKSKVVVRRLGSLKIQT